MSTTEQQNEMKTIGEIAREIGKPNYSIAYLISSRGIRESRRVGIIRLFDADAVAQIKAAAEEIGN